MPAPTRLLAFPTIPTSLLRGSSLTEIGFHGMMKNTRSGSHDARSGSHDAAEGIRVKTAFVYTKRYLEYDYGDSHPLKIERLSLTFELCRAYGLLDFSDSRFIETVPATEAEVLRFHTPAYVKVLREASEGTFRGVYPHGLGPGDNPIFPGLWEWSLLHTGATLQCAKLVADREGRIAFNIAGGLHHARADRASGFCYVNDPALAILHLLEKGYRVMYLDIDAHHGDGVQWAFYEEPRVLTVSFHQDGHTLFPGTGSVTEMGRGAGLGYAVNVPMLPGTDDEVFWLGFSAIVPQLMECFKPDVIVSQLGVDSFVTDPLASLELTNNGFSEVISFLKEQAPAWVALGGGGYNVRNVARAWTLAWAIMNGVDLPDDLPQRIGHHMLGGGKLRDPVHHGTRGVICRERMRECIHHIEQNVLPLIR
jgi:acetoin utilization protein AcuC